VRPRVVVLRALGLGDLLTGLPALRAVADAFGGHDTVVAMPKALAPLLDLAELDCGVADHRGLGPLPEWLRGPDAAINLHGRGPQSSALLRALDPGWLLAFGEGPQWRADEHEVQRWCRMLEESGIPADPGRLDLMAPPLERGDPAHGATLLHPGAGSRARRWPVERWAHVARAEREAGHEVVLTGSTEEAGLALSIAHAAGLPASSVRAGATDVVGLAALVAAAGRVVCGDTGVAHLATALGTPSVVLFGPTPPAEWGPPPDRAQHRTVWGGERGDPHGEAVDPGLVRIGADRVLAELREL
jgi:ADP-heptose:LPS heptosyltransferase